MGLSQKPETKTSMTRTPSVFGRQGLDQQQEPHMKSVPLLHQTACRTAFLDSPPPTRGEKWVYYAVPECVDQFEQVHSGFLPFQSDRLLPTRRTKNGRRIFVDDANSYL